MTAMNRKLEILLQNQGWRQKDLAERLYVTQTTVSSWIRGKNHLSIETIRKLCDIFCISIEVFTNDDLEIPEFFEIERLPSIVFRNHNCRNDSTHIVIDAALAGGARLHRFRNKSGAECSGIYRGSEEIWWHYREYEPRMIHDWNEVYSDDR